MRIERVTLKNYRSFSDCDLDLTGVEHGLLCSGPTGSGKSSLIDAILWAAYGKSRSRRADGYIKIGADTCSVTVEFAVNGGHYRVTRTRSIKTKAGKSDLQLQARNGEGWTPLSGKSIPETEQKIERLIGVGYDVLTSGNFSLQGQADKFTRAAVSDRIAVLSDLLGLSVYQAWRETAGRQARDLDREAATLETQVVGAERALADRPNIEARQTHGADALRECRLVLEDVTARRRQAEREIATLEAQLPVLQKEQAAFADDRQALWARQKTRGEKQAKLDRLQQIVGKRAEIEAKSTEYENTEVALEIERRSLTSLDDEIAEARKVLTDLQAENMAAKVHNTTIAMQVQKVTGELHGLEPLIAGNQKRVLVMETVPCMNTPGFPETCPLLKDARYSREELAILCDRRETLKAWRAPDPTPERPTEEATRALARLDDDRRRRLSRIAAAEKQLKDLARWTALVPELEHAAAEIPGLQVELAALDAEIAALNAKLAGAGDIATRIEFTGAQLRAVQRTLGGCEAQLRQAQADERAALQAMTQATEQLAGLDALAEQTAAARAAAQRIRARHAQVVALELFYKQAPLMILENDALPAIETEANRLLARISQSGMRLQLRTQREVKSRDALADGLDIVIQDQVGEREYEAYSGGQQFQIDLALRVALAKLQARKAGARIDSLIVDEGLGTQSIECLDAIVTALREVQKEFPLLWVITHVESLKDCFPARIKVWGGPVDSHAELEIA